MSADQSDAAQRVEQLIVLTERLCTMMLRETEAFEAHKPHEALSSAEETQRMANLYRHESMKVRKDPNLIGRAPAEARARLTEATRTFDNVLARHGRAVEAAKVITEGLVRAIAQEVASQRATGPGYGPGAQARMGSQTSVTLNRQA